MTGWITRHVPQLAGFLLAANLYLLPTVPSSPRATDALAAALALWLAARLAAGRQRPGPLVVLGLTVLWPAGWLVISLLDGDPPTAVQAVRWLLAVPWAVALAAWLDSEADRERFAWGLMLGGALNIAVVLLQAAGLEPQLRLVGLSSSGSQFYHYVGQTVRIPGLHGQHNASSTVVSLMVPAGLYLYFRGRCSLLLLLGSLVGFLIVLHLTSTRSPLVVAVLTVAYAFLAAREIGRGVAVTALLVTVIVPLVMIYGPPGGWSRWRDASAITANAGERLDSNAEAAVIAVENPLGLGVTRGKETLFDASGLRATHNAYLQAAVYLGLPLGLALLVALTTVALRGLGGRDSPLLLPGLLAFHCGGVFFFEEHLNNPTFVILAAWLLVMALTPRRRLATDRPALEADGPHLPPEPAPDQR